MLITIAIPCYRSEKTLPAVLDEIRATFEKQDKYQYQVILVNDGSPDHTLQVIRQLCLEDKNILGLDLSRNFGQAFAKMAALSHVKGEIMVYMDDDGQHPASQIFRLIEKIEEGYDIAYARFPHKKHNLFKRMTSSIQAKIGEWVGNKPKGIQVSSYFALSKFCIEQLQGYTSPFPSMLGYLMQFTTKIANADIDHRERIAGKSGYSLKKMVRLWLMSFTNFSITPLRIASLLGTITACSGFLWGLWIIIRKVISPNIMAGYSSIMATLLLLGGIIMIMLGLLGEYIGRTYLILSNMPQYSIREIIIKTEEPCSCKSDHH